MRSDNKIPFGWRNRYNLFRSKFDLRPRWYATPWGQLTLEDNEQGEASFQLSEDFWLYGINVASQVQYGEEQPYKVGNKLPGIWFRFSFDGILQTGDWLPPPVWSGGQTFRGQGNGWWLRAGTVVKVEWLRARPADITGENPIKAEAIQFVVEGCDTLPRGRATYLGDDGQTLRNATLADWDRGYILEPYTYNFIGESDEGEGGPFQIATRDKTFLVEQLQVYTINDLDGPFTGAFARPDGLQFPDIIITDETGLWHNVLTGGISTAAAFGLGQAYQRDLRIPRLLQANRTLSGFLPGWYFNVPEDYPRGYGVLFTGYEILGVRDK